MRAVLLTEKPLSGTFPEVAWASASGRNLWVQFGDGDASWVGVFGAGESAFSCVTPLGDDEGEAALVIAGGQGFVVDVPARTLLRKTEWDYAWSAARVPEADLVVVADSCTLICVGRTDDLPCVAASGHALFRNDPDPHRIALDGILLSRVRATHVVGYAERTDSWREFSLDLRTRSFTVGGPANAVVGGLTASEQFGGFPCASAYEERMRRYLLP